MQDRFVIAIGRQLGSGGRAVGGAEHMRVAVDHLFTDAVAHAVDIEYPFFAFHFRVEHDLKQHIPQLFL